MILYFPLLKSANKMHYPQPLQSKCVTITVFWVAILCTVV